MTTKNVRFDQIRLRLGGIRHKTIFCLICSFFAINVDIMAITWQNCTVFKPICPSTQSLGYGQSDCPSRPCCGVNSGPWTAVECIYYPVFPQKTLYREFMEINGRWCYRDYIGREEWGRPLKVDVYRCQYYDNDVGDCDETVGYYQTNPQWLGPEVYLGDCFLYLTDFVCEGILA